VCVFVFSLSLNLQLYEYGRASVKVSCSLECLRVVTDAFPCINKAVRFVSVLLQRHRRSSFRDKRSDSGAELLKQRVSLLTVNSGVNSKLMKGVSMYLCSLLSQVFSKMHHYCLRR